MKWAQKKGQHLLLYQPFIGQTLCKVMNIINPTSLRGSMVPHFKEAITFKIKQLSQISNI